MHLLGPTDLSLRPSTPVPSPSNSTSSSRGTNNARGAFFSFEDDEDDDEEDVPPKQTSGPTATAATRNAAMTSLNFDSTVQVADMAEKSEVQAPVTARVPITARFREALMAKKSISDSDLTKKLSKSRREIAPPPARGSSAFNPFYISPQVSYIDITKNLNVGDNEAEAEGCGRNILSQLSLRKLKSATQLAADSDDDEEQSSDAGKATSAVSRSTPIVEGSGALEGDHSPSGSSGARSGVFLLGNTKRSTSDGVIH